MIDISFVQDNLPTPEEQLELFKQQVESRNKDNLYTFNWINNLEDVSGRDIQRLDLGTELDNYCLRLNDIVEGYLNKTVQNMLQHLSLALIWQFEKRDNKIVNIFLPTNLPYIVPSQYGQRLYLNGTIQYYFD